MTGFFFQIKKLLIFEVKICAHIMLFCGFGAGRWGRARAGTSPALQTVRRTGAGLPPRPERTGRGKANRDARSTPAPHRSAGRAPRDAEPTLRSGLMPVKRPEPKAKEGKRPKRKKDPQTHHHDPTKESGQKHKCVQTYGRGIEAYLGFRGHN